MASTWGSSWGNSWLETWGGATAPAVTTPTTGGGKSKRKKWPKKVMVHGRLYTVRNREEEISLLQAALDRAQYQAAVTPSLELEKPIPRLQKRLKKVESERDRWLKRLKQADEELILLLH